MPKRATDATKEPTAAKVRVARRVLRTQKFYLEDGVEVTIRFEPGTVRWTSTQNSVAIASGQAAAPAVPFAVDARSFTGAPQRADSWSNCDDRGLGFVQGTADPKETLKNGIPAIASGTPLAPQSVDFLSRVEDNVMVSEGATVDELEGELLSGGEIADA